MKYIIILALILNIFNTIALAQEITFTNNSEQIYLITNEGRIERLKGLTRPGWNITKINPFKATSMHFEMRRCGKKEGKENQYYVFTSPEVSLDFKNATLSGTWPRDASQGTTLYLQTDTNNNIPLTMNQTAFTEKDCRSLVH